jgi:hypothetical protein
MQSQVQALDDRAKEERLRQVSTPGGLLACTHVVAGAGRAALQLVPLGR